MIIATKTEAQEALTRARERAGKGYLARQDANNQIDMDAAVLHYDRCIRELEQAINDMGNFENGED